MGQCLTQPKLTLKEAGRFFSEREVVTEAYLDVSRDVHGQQVSVAKSKMMGQCLTQKKLTLKEVGRILPRQKLSKRPTLMLQQMYMAHGYLPQSQT